MTRTWFFDLDGPILDVSRKYYRVYADILSQHGYIPLSKPEYWEMKRNKVSEKRILAKSRASAVITSYQALRKKIIESDSYLKFDVIQPGARSVLRKVALFHRPVLVTLRQSAEQLENQLERLDLKHYFISILSSGRETVPRWKIKWRLIRKYSSFNRIEDGVLVGDTETDILAGNHLGFTTVAVSNGIRAYPLLAKSHPTILVESIRQIPIDRLFSKTPVE
jgi:phosphoglycolate phosphatase-like HAD superfamily hydrolase